MTEQAQEQTTATGDQTQDQQQQPYFVAQTKEEYERVYGPTRVEGRDSALKELGFDDLDSAKAYVAEQRQVEEELKTEAEREIENRYKGQLTDAQGERDRYKAALTTLLEKEREGLPEHITSLLDGRDPDEQLSWIASNREAISEASKPQTVGRGSAPGSSGSRSTLVGIDKVRAASGL